MSKLTQESAKDIIKFNRETLYHLPVRYKNLNYYLSAYKGSVHRTLLRIYNFIKDKEIIFYKHKYIFFMDNKTLTYKARNVSTEYNTSSGTSARHMELLCAIGFFNKQYQNAEDENYQIEINKNFLRSQTESVDPDGRRKQPINVYYFRRYTTEELDRLEERARRLREAHVTSGNISYNYLVVNGLKDIADEVLPNNNKSSPEKKQREYISEFLIVLDGLLAINGYATKQQLKDNLSLEDTEIDKLFRIFKNDLNQNYYYKRPNKQQMEQYNLPDQKFIYTRKDV